MEIARRQKDVVAFLSIYSIARARSLARVAILAATRRTGLTSPVQWTSIEASPFPVDREKEREGETLIFYYIYWRWHFQRPRLLNDRERERERAVQLQGES